MWHKERSQSVYWILLLTAIAGSLVGGPAIWLITEEIQTALLYIAVLNLFCLAFAVLCSLIEFIAFYISLYIESFDKIVDNDDDELEELKQNLKELQEQLQKEAKEKENNNGPF